MVLAFVLVDCRLEPQPIDLEFMQWMGESQVPFSIIFTKADKLKPNALKKNIETYKQKMLEVWEEMPQHFITSASNTQGREELLGFLGNLNNEIDIS
jgi:GTP-binding protein